MDTITETKLFSCFRAHYGFRIRFCNPHAGHEKGNVENKVGTTDGICSFRYQPIMTLKSSTDHFLISTRRRQKKTIIRRGRRSPNCLRKTKNTFCLFQQSHSMYAAMKPTGLMDTERFVLMENTFTPPNRKIITKTLLLAYALTTLMFWNRTETFLSVICASTEQHART